MSAVPISTYLLVRLMAKAERHFDGRRHTSLVSESWHEPAGGPWVRCYADFYCERDGWGMVLQYWLTVRADGSNLTDAVLEQLSSLTDDTVAFPFDDAQFIGLVRP